MLARIVALWLAVTAGTVMAADAKNDLFANLLDPGVAMPDGARVKLPAPTLEPHADAAAQAAAITKILPPRATLAQFLEKTSQAPTALRIRTLHGHGDAVFRTIDLWFAAHGDWKILTSRRFGDSIVKSEDRRKATARGEGHILSRAGLLKDDEMRARKLNPQNGAEREERFFYTTFTLFDEAEVSVTRRIVLTRGPASVLLAAAVDPRFAHDGEYPNQWRAIERDAAANRQVGPPQPYSGAAFYIQAVRLREPADVIFVEYHAAFNEPHGWFEGANVLRAKLPTIIQHQAEQFRGKLARMTAANAAEVPTAPSPASR
jgi:hypothetical protein